MSFKGASNSMKYKCKINVVVVLTQRFNMATELSYQSSLTEA